MTKPIAIGIIGANGVVGSEVCLYLQQREGLKVIPICRTTLSSVFLRRAALECRHGSLQKAEEATDLLSGCDVVVDFSLPRGLPSQFRPAARALITNAIASAPAKAPFVYISSTMAFGMPRYNGKLKNYVISRSAYGLLKRYSENVARRAATKERRPLYILRIGHVHGEMQPISRLIRKTLQRDTAYVPDGQSHSVFAFTIAEAIAQIAHGRERPGEYTIISNPQWTWEEIHQFYCWRAGFPSEIIKIPPKSRRSPGSRRRQLAQYLAGPFLRKLIEKDISEVLKGYLLWRIPQLERWAMAQSFNYQTNREIAEGRKQAQYHPYEDFDDFVTEMPGTRMRSLSDIRQSIRQLSKEMEARLLTLSSEGPAAQPQWLARASGIGR